MLTVLKRIAMVLLVIIVVFTIGVALFVNFAPQFGQSPKGKDLDRIKQSEHYQDNEFVNLIETRMDLEFSKMPGLLMEFINPPKGKNPNEKLPTKWQEGDNDQVDSLAFVTWYGHSAILLEIDHKKILIDPMLGEYSSPVSSMTKRFAYEKPISLDNMARIDAIIISHDHYDHLDHTSILKLKDKTDHFFTALGVGSHLKHWGVPEEIITELDWWQSEKYLGLNFTAAPARHFSGRGITDRNKTQWASWVIEGKHQKTYFSGDGGYGSHFKEIGERLGPFDFAMVECGQYNKMWSAIHMMPEQSVQAAIDVKAKLAMPIHWGAFDLAPHQWQDPIIRFSAEAQKLHMPYTTPTIGERFSINEKYPSSKWWEL
jgi:L-ascorbate metabolism protein UlaG (beta-lactamase superfamily)